MSRKTKYISSIEDDFYGINGDADSCLATLILWVVCFNSYWNHVENLTEKMRRKCCVVMKKLVHLQAITMYHALPTWLNV